MVVVAFAAVIPATTMAQSVTTTVQFSAASQSEVEDIGSMTVTAQLNQVSSLDVTVPFTISGTATMGAGNDFTITSSPIIIPAGSLSSNITIFVNNDSLYEMDETIVVTMGIPINANKGTPNVHTATILDNDMTPTQIIQDVITNLEISEELPEGFKNSLVSKLEAAVKSIGKGQSNASANQLQAFINHVKAQKGKKKIAEQQADDLISEVETIIDDI